MNIGAQVLGSVRLFADGRPIDVGGPRQRRLLAALLMADGGVVSTDRLIDVVWEGEPPEGANTTFRTYVAKLRRSIEASGAPGADAVIVTSPPGYVLARDLVDIDAAGFEERLNRAQIDLDVGEAASALDVLDEALEMWHGPAYAEFADEEWVHVEAIRLDRLRVVAREQRVQARLDLGLHRDAIPEIEALVGEYPLEERPRSQLMLALYRSGRHAEALRAYRDYVAFLANETGLEPSSELADLEDMILNRDPRLDLQLEGRKLRGYRLGDPIGEGSLGVTYRATQPSVGREVAIKVIPEELANDPNFVRRFEVEAQQVARIEHPHVVPLYDYWREPGGAYLVTRYMSGGSLEQRIDEQGPVALDEATRVIDEVGGALVAAHERGIVHGDVKPANVLFDDSGNAYLAGFGIAAHDQSATVHDDIAGLGVVLLTMLIGRPLAAADYVVDLRGDEARVEAAPAVAAVAQKALQGDPETGFASMRGLLQAFHDVTEPESAVPALGLRPVVDQPNPYKGLYAFTEADARDFFGREALVDDLVEHLDRHRFLAVVGPSGSGKSSVVRAGLVPRLRQSGSFVASMMPGSAPFAELEIALLRVATESVPSLLDDMRSDDSGIARATRLVLPGEDNNLVVVVDQFEELFTLTDPDERDRFLTGLRYAVEEHTRLRVCITARADFLDRILNHPIIGDLVRQRTVLVTPLNPDELHQAIVGPAERVGVAVAPALATAMVADAHGAPGSLPLLQYALTETYDRRDDGTMTVEAYHQLGDMTGVLTQRADEIYTGLDPEGQQATRQLMSRLITPGEGVDDTRRRARRSELSGVPDDVIDAYGTARLLSFDNDPETREPTVEVAHEALIQRWPRLRAWVDEDRDGLRILSHLTIAAAEWDADGRDPSELYRGARLATADEWATDNGDALSSIEQEFLDASRAVRDAEAEAERRRVRRLRFLVAGFAAVAVVAVVAGVVALRQSQIADDNAAAALAAADAEAEARAEADRERTEAEQQASIAQAREIVLEAEKALEFDPELSAHLALASLAAFTEAGENPAQAVSALRAAVANDRVTFRIPGRDIVSVHPDGSLLATAEGDAIAVWDIASREVVERYARDGGSAGGVAFSPDGDLLAVVFSDAEPPITAWDRTTGESFTIGTQPGWALDLAFSPDGELIAFESAFPGIEVWSITERRVVYNDELGFSPDFNADGLMSYAVQPPPDGDGTWDVRIIDPVSADLVNTFSVKNLVDDLTGGQFTSWAPDGTRIAVGNQVQTAVIDAESGEEVSRTDGLDRAFRPEWLPDGEAYFLGGEVNPKVIDAATGEVRLELVGLGEGSGTWGYDVVPGTTLVASAALTFGSPGGDTVLFDTTPVIGELGGWVSSIEFGPTYRGAGFTEDARMVVTGRGNNSYGTADALDGGNARIVPVGPGFFLPFANANGSFVSYADPDGNSKIRATDTGEVVYEAPQGWSVQNVSWDGRRAVISTVPQVADPLVDDCFTHLVSIEDGSVGPELSDTGCPAWTFFSPDGQLLFMVPDLNRSGALFETDTGDLVVDFEDTPYETHIAAFTPDGREIVVGFGHEYVLDIETLLAGAPIEEAVRLDFVAHETFLAMLAVSPDGTMAATSNREDPLKLWDLRTGKLIGEFGDKLDVVGMHIGDFHPSLPYLMVTTPPNEVRIHTLDIDELVAIAEAKLTRELTDDECQQYFRGPCSDF